MLQTAIVFEGLNFKDLRSDVFVYFPIKIVLDAESKLNVHSTLRRRLERLLNSYVHSIYVLSPEDSICCDYYWPT